jgi:ribosomal protein S12 methylthiotransferase accessory factor
MTTIAPLQPGAGAALTQQATAGPRARLEAALTARYQRAMAGGSRWLAEPVVAVLSGASPPEDLPARMPNVWLAKRVVLAGPWPWAGAQAGCGRCLQLRWERIRPDYERLAAVHDARTSGPAAGGPAGRSAWPLLTEFLLDAVWQAFEHACAQSSGQGRSASQPPDSSGEVSVTQVIIRSLHTVTFPLLADSTCPDCATGSECGPGTPAQLPVPGSQAKSGPDSYRLRDARGYLLPRQALANPVCGALGTTTEQSLLWPTTAPISGSYKLRLNNGGLAEMNWSGQANSFALSGDLAFIEGLERYAGTQRRHRAPVRIARYADISGDALDPRDCGLYSDLGYDADPTMRPFTPELETSWVQGWSLRDERALWVPTRLVYYGPDAMPGNFVQDSSNGCASGGSIGEAVLFGLLELMERDAFLLGWYGNARLPRIDLSTSANPELRNMIDRASYLGYDVLAFDSRIDLPVPVVTGLAVRRDGGDGYLSFGAAASLDPEAALHGAVAEILTYIPALATKLRSRRAEVAAMAIDFTLVRHLADHPALFTLPEMAPHASRYLDGTGPGPASVTDTYAAWNAVRPRHGDLLDDIRFCRGVLAGAGFDVIAVDQTCLEQSTCGLHTVATIVPGLLPIDFGWSKQRALGMPRLRSAFRRAGWRSTDLCDEELHLVPHPFP